MTIADLFQKFYDAEGKLVAPQDAVLVIEAESDVDLVNKREITHRVVRCTVWAADGGKFSTFLGEFSRWEPAKRRALECLERVRKGRP